MKMFCFSWFSRTTNLYQRWIETTVSAVVSFKFTQTDKVWAMLSWNVYNNDWKAPQIERFETVFKRNPPSWQRLATTPLPRSRIFKEFRYNLFDHPFYSTDIVSSDYLLFLHLKQSFGGQWFERMINPILSLSTGSICRRRISMQWSWRNRCRVNNSALNRLKLIFS